MSSVMHEMALVPLASNPSSKADVARSAVGIALALGIIHLVVDATTVSVVIRASQFQSFTPSDAFAAVLVYDLVAFGSQVLLGAIADRWWSPTSALRLGLLLAIGSVFGTAWHPFLAIALAGTGNALFHLGAGAVVLGRDLSKATPAGLFVAPGALGLAFGMNYGRMPHWGPLWPLAIAAAMALLITWFMASVFGTEPAQARRPSSTTGLVSPIALALILLLVSISVRSLVGLSATRGLAASPWLMFGVPLMAFAGKSLGGYLADHFGWIRTSVGALVISCPLIVFGSQQTALLLVGLLLFQMTMPVTLTAVARLMPESLATAFGWTCLALIGGALPTMFPVLAPICTRPALLVWILVGTIALAWGLRRVGVREASIP